MPTPHIEAKPGDFCKTVLMPGDPLRAEFIAKNYLDGAVLVNGVRGALGFSGKYKGKPVSVMASGMGMPSIGIYSFELYNEYGVENIIRIGSCGGMSERVRVRDIVVGLAASTNSRYASQYGLDGSFAPCADYGLLKAFMQTAGGRENVKVGNILSSDTFYSADPQYVEKWSSMGVLAVEMEAAALYMNAARLSKRALCVCTVSDHLLSNEALSSAERQTSFTEMMELALDTAVSI